MAVDDLPLKNLMRAVVGFRAEPAPLPFDTLEETRMSLLDRIAEWPAQDYEQWLAGQRRLLGCMTALRFGDDAADRIAVLLEDIADPDRIAKTGRLILFCGAGEELIARIEELQAAA